MANSNSFDPMASWARLSERVENQGKDIVDLRSNMNTGFQTINSAIGSLSNDFRANSRTQWPVIWTAAGVCSGILLAAGSFFYGTLTRTQNRLDLAIAKVAESTISQATFTDWKATYENNRIVRRNDYIDKFGALTDRIESVQKDQVPRAELERVWHTDDLVKAELQKQIDELKASAAATYGARDVLLELRERLDRVERERLQARAPD